MNKNIPFTKMHGLGNDFIIINSIDNPLIIASTSIKKLAHRQLGIGFDQLLLIGPSDQADFSCKIFNSDGSEAEQCGNGMRCVARYIHEEKLSNKDNLTIETRAGILHVSIQDYDHIQVNMGIPLFDAKTKTDIKLDGAVLNLTTLSLGNPHAILDMTSLKECPIGQWGPQISTHPIFPNGTNVGFMKIINPGHICLRTHERGAGETWACGSNACAAVAAGIKHQLLQSTVIVELAFGNLKVDWKGEGHPIYMTGPAARVYEGKIKPP